MRLVAALFVIAASASVSAQTADVASIRPTAVNPIIVPISFATKPTVQASVGRDQAFLEGELAYGYGGRITTDVMFQKQIVIPAGSPAYAIPMISRDGRNGLVWCAFRLPVREGMPNSCLLGDLLGGESNDSLMITGLIVSKLYGKQFRGGAIQSANFNLGATIKVAYYIQNLGKMTRIRAEIDVGDIKVNQWGIQFGSITSPSSGDEKIVYVGGGALGIQPDPTSKGHYLVRVVKPLEQGQSAVLRD